MIADIRCHCSSDHENAGEPLFHSGNHQAFRHFRDFVVRNDSSTFAISAAAFFDRDVEKNRLYVTIIKVGQLDVRASLPGREIRSVNVGYRTAEFDSLLQKIAKNAKDPTMNFLICRIVRQEFANMVAGQGRCTELVYVGRLAGSWQTD
jgi:hypothetical protein